MRLFFLLLSLLGIHLGLHAQADRPYLAQEGQVSFRSEAPLELIEAGSQRLRAAIDPATGTFAFSLPIASFQGFNSPLQQEHFNEKFMETPRFPQATFSGKFIEQLDYSQPGTYVVRAKGDLTVHGITQERIIKGSLRIGSGEMEIDADFSILLVEHQISIPKIVQQKIAEEIQVHVACLLTPRTR
jgi:hypothetical protein